MLAGDKAWCCGAAGGRQARRRPRRRDKGLSLFLVDRQKPRRCKPYVTIDGMRAADVIVREGRRASCSATEGGALPVIEHAVDFAIALALRRSGRRDEVACDATLEYLKTRKQFGVPIGTFQALQHRMVDMTSSYEQAQSMACLAASKARRRGGREGPRALGVGGEDQDRRAAA